MTNNDGEKWERELLAKRVARSFGAGAASALAELGRHRSLDFR